jgi:hypothetical protein
VIRQAIERELSGGHQLNSGSTTALDDLSKLVLSKRTSGGKILEGVRFVNPFTAGFRREDWA